MTFFILTDLKVGPTKMLGFICFVFKGGGANIDVCLCHVNLGRLRDLSKYYEVLNDFGGYFFGGIWN